MHFTNNCVDEVPVHVEMMPLSESGQFSVTFQCNASLAQLFVAKMLCIDCKENIQVENKTHR